MNENVVFAICATLGVIGTGITAYNMYLMKKMVREAIKDDKDRANRR